MDNEQTVSPEIDRGKRPISVRINESPEQNLAFTAKRNRISLLDRHFSTELRSISTSIRKIGTENLAREANPGGHAKK